MAGDSAFANRNTGKISSNASGISKKGESSDSHIALLEGRIQLRNGKPQIYGAQITTDQETVKPIVYEIKDLEYVNQRRKEVGLGYVKRWGVEWMIEQKENRVM